MSRKGSEDASRSDEGEPFSWLLALLLSALLLYTGRAQATLISLDDLRGSFPSYDLDITGVFRSPTVGPPFSAAWYQPTGSAKAYLVQALDGQAARVVVPQGGSLDYMEDLGGSVWKQNFLDNLGYCGDRDKRRVGMFFVRFPTVDNGIRDPIGFLDDGRLIRFSGPPAVDTLVPLGTFQAGTRYKVRFEYDLIAHCFSASLNGVRIVNREPIPSHFNVGAIDKFGFDITRILPLANLHPRLQELFPVLRLEIFDSMYFALP